MLQVVSGLETSNALSSIKLRKDQVSGSKVMRTMTLTSDEDIPTTGGVTGHLGLDHRYACNTFVVWKLHVLLYSFRSIYLILG